MNVAPLTKPRTRLKWRHVCAIAPGFAVLFAAAPVAWAAPPSAGAVLQQTTPPPATLAPPGPVLPQTPSAVQPLKSSVMLTVNRLVIRGNHALSTAMLQKLLAPAQGQHMSLATLQTYVERITQAYHARGYPIAYAYLPPQNIRGGVVQIAVVEPDYDQIQVTGHSRLRKSMVRHTVLMHTGEPVMSATLERSLLLLGQTPGVTVEGSLIPGAQPQTSTLNIERHDLPLFTANVSQNNYGNRYTGSYLTNATITANNPFGYGSSAAVSGIVSQTGGLKAGGITLVSPNIWNGLRAGVYGSAVYYRLGGKFASLRQVGRETQAGANLTYPLILQPGRQLNVRLDALGDWQTQSTRSTGDRARQMIVIERLSVYGVVQDDWGGITTANAALTHGHLSITPGAAQAIDANGPNARGDYLIGRLRLGRTQSLPAGIALSVDASGQIASKNLDSSQKLYLGGPYGVMSYAVGSGGGDEGYLFSARLTHELPVPYLPGELSASLLAQDGTVWINHTTYPGFTGTNRIDESGAGFGLAYSWRQFSVNGAYVMQIGEHNGAGIADGGDRFWFQVGTAL